MDDLQFEPDITSDDRLWALLSYIFSPLIPIILLLMEEKRERPFLKAHLVQALVVGVVVYVLGSVLAFVGIGLCIIGIGAALEIYFGILAFQGKFVRIPVLTDFIKRQGWS